jgi:CheY-like chemotaxis protein
MSAVPAMPEKPLVLVVDDDAIMRELLRLHLANAGCEVLAAEDGIAGGYQVLKRQPDLVIVDVDMPYMTGYQLVEALKADPATNQVPVLFLSSREDVDERAAKLGAQAYLRKPVKADRLLEVVALYTDRSSPELPRPA